MRITKIKADAIAAIPANEIILAGRSVEDVIEYAVQADHPCDDVCCDIRACLENGYPLAAARLLVNATDAPHLSATLDALAFNGVDVDLRAAFEQWCAANVPNYRCEKCDARAYGVDVDDEWTCSNCGRKHVATTDLAEALGYAEGVTDGKWVIDGNTSSDTVRECIRMNEDGDPSWSDHFGYVNHPLSGEFADGTTPESLARELNVPWADDFAMDKICTAFECGYANGWEGEVMRMAYALNTAL